MSGYIAVKKKKALRSTGWISCLSHCLLEVIEEDLHSEASSTRWCLTACVSKKWIEIQEQLLIAKKQKVQQFGLQHPENKHCSTALRIPAPASLSVLCVRVFFHSQLCVSCCAPEWSHIDGYWFWRVFFLLNQSTVPTGLCSSPCIVHSHFKLWIYFQERSHYSHVFNRCTIQKLVNNMQVNGAQN